MTLNVGMQHRVLEYYQVRSNDDHGLTVDLDLFYDKVKYGPLCFCMGKKGNIMDFPETIVVYDIKVARFIQLTEYRNLYEYQRSRSFTDLRPRSLRFNIFTLLLLRNR